MTGFTKLWAEILSSSVWNEDDKVRIVWITMLASMPPDYVVRASVGGLAHLARVSREDCEHALKVLTSPDLDSRSKEFEGRRVEVVDGGFKILNGGKYREARNLDERKAYMAEYMRNYRQVTTKKGVNKSVNKRKQKLTSVNQRKPLLAQAEAEAEAEAEEKKGIGDCVAAAQSGLGKEADYWNSKPNLPNVRQSRRIEREIWRPAGRTIFLSPITVRRSIEYRKPLSYSEKTIADGKRRLIGLFNRVRSQRSSKGSTRKGNRKPPTSPTSPP